MTMPTNPAEPGAQTPTERLTCEQVTDAIIDYLTGEMQPEISTLFNKHLQVCPDCVAFVNTYNSTVRPTRSLSYDDVPEEMRARVRQFLLKTITGE
jgi:predicted anti-sigma-YlaC factor YlaD